MKEASAMLEQEVKLLIIDALHLEDITPDAIDPAAPLFGRDGDGLGLDSIDVLELGLALDARYGVTLPPDAPRQSVSVRMLAALIAAHRAQ
jgi:acyl carrier protein